MRRLLSIEPSTSSTVTSTSATPIADSMLDATLALHPQVALRPEPFGALAYHYGNRKLIFLKHPDVVRVVQALDGTTTVADTLTACDIDEARWPSFQKALTNLCASEMLT